MTIPFEIILFHRVTEYLKLERTCKDHKLSTPCWAPLKLKDMTVSITQTLLELWQTWCHDHLTGEPVPVVDHPLREETFTNVTYESPLSFIFWSPERRDQHLPCHCPPWGLQWGHPQPLLLEAEQTKQPQQFFVSPWGISSSWLTCPGHISITWCLLILRHPKLDTMLEGRLGQCT